ncbi:MAG: PEP-CTERM sorting domain-containing protein [Methylobacter sp.]|nr:PEP-CTERM sorting domain-containing protein [Methylobacter sp.]
MHYILVPLLFISMLWTATASAAPFTFSTGGPDGRLASGSRPESTGKIEIESADDFILNQSTQINHATFTGLLTGGATVSNIGNVDVEIYRVFPKDSQNPPSGAVPTRVNSPSDVAFETRAVGDSTLSYTTNVLNNNFTAANSILNGINPIPNQQTGGEGPVSGREVTFNVDFTTPLSLAADHYFFIPQVEVTGGEFLWLSAPKPIEAGTGPFSPDLQSWIRNGNLDPNWLRMGTDIVGAELPFNASFSLDGQLSAVPLPASLFLFGGGFAAIFAKRGKKAIMALTA